MANTLESTSLPELQGFTRIGTDTVRHPRIEPGKLYSEAVRRCIRCDFDRRDMDLDSENFQEAVFDGVVVPLDTTLQQFSGQLP